MWKKLWLSLVFAGFATFAHAQATFTAKDAAGATQTFKSVNCSANICAISVPVDSTGAPIFGIAGTANANVLTVQGIASMTPILATVTGSVTVSGTVTANAGTNLNTSALALETGGNLATTVTNTGATSSGVGATGDAAATAGGTGSLSSKLRLATTQLGTINTTLGSPFQAGGSIGNTSFASTQSGTWTIQPGNTANTTAWLVTGTGGTFPTTAASGAFASGSMAAGSQVDLLTMRGTKNAGTGAANSLLAGAIFNSTPLTLTDTQQASLQADANGFLKVNVAAGGASGGTSSSFSAAFPSTGTAAGMSQGGNMVALTGTSGNLNVQCANCSGSGVSTVDEATFTAATSLFAGTGGFFQTTATANALTNGQQGMWQMTANRAGFVNLRDTAGVAIGTSAAEVFVGGRGTAGSAAGGVLTVQGSASGTPIPVSGTVTATPTGTQAVSIASAQVASGAFASGSIASGAIASGAIAAGAQVDLLTMRGTKNAGTGAANSLLTGGIFNSTPLTLTDTQQSSLQLDASGFLKVNVATATGLVQGSTTSGQTLSLIGGAVTTASPTYTTAQTSPLSLDTTGALRVNVTAGGAGGGAVTIASGAVASGAYASGSIASGAYASGSIGSGAMVDLGAIADAASTAGSTGSVNAKLRLMTTQLGTINTTLGSPFQAGASIGNTAFNTSSATAPVSTMNSSSANAGVTAASAFVFDDASPTAITENSFGYARMSANRNQYATLRDAAGNERGVNVTAGNALVVDGSASTQPVSATNLSTNISQINAVTPLMGNGATGTGSLRVTVANDSSAIAVKGEGATGSTVPTGAQLAGAQSGANMVALIQASASAAINVSTATTTQLVAISGSTKIYVTSYDVIAGGTGNITFVYGTGTNCGTGTTSLTGAYNLTAQAGIAKGSGLGPVLVVPAGNALCVTTSAAVQMSGSVAYTQF